ncbi:DUF3105 domain-containing protein [Pyxidicoccus fallax]|uniref:DUF3105 domain-containing protein n=1 Tax=Pyxidicoccus fallax TaxID=394095 RepID=A0A848LAI8_9BACT|nr:DUF3105 domain-containing protein [Pyxidicoccus fallax]NMO13865.1 DUF3105 domain-containing protein [Pyxidicoccus fallax]NPC77657.1 DUF3105 domain-containing protein [Pyxidicoccus fallax]
MTRSRVLVPSLVALLSLTACGSTDPEPDPQGCDRFDFPLSAQTEARHVSSCSSDACGSGGIPTENPPRSGLHCGSVARCGVYTEPVSRCLYIHNLEHGHAVFLYNCPDGCPEEVARLEAAAASVPAGANGVRRALVAQDPQMPTRVAAMLWRRAYLTDSADPEALQCLLRLQDAEAPEPGLGCPGQ